MSSGSCDSRPVKAADAGASQEFVVNLQVLSPSVGVNRPLLFPDLPAVTTIRQLKDRIRQALPLRPADENQRLIHRGRALLRESDTLLDVFGADALRVPDRQTIHLVVREPNDIHSSSPAPTAHTTPASMAQHGAHIHFGPQPPPAFARRTHSQPAAAGGPNARVPSPSLNQQAHANADPAAVFQQHHQNMSNWLSQVQRDAMTRTILQQHQLGRAHMGMRGIGDSTGAPNHAGANPADPNSGRASRAPTQTMYRETVGPNGHTYHVETIIRSGTPGQQTGLSTADVQNILRGADATQATAAMTSAMQRSASAASLHGRPLNQPGVTTPLLGTRASTAGSGRATPDSSARSGLGPGHFPVSTGMQDNQSRQDTHVYIISSPEGPRGLLVNNATAEMYFTPTWSSQNSMPNFRTPPGFANLAYAATLPQTPHNVYQQHPPQQQQQQGPQGPQQHRRNNAEVVNDQLPAPMAGQGGLHPANPPAAGIPPLLLQAWPHGVFTSLIENLGVKDVQCEELISLDPDDLLVLQPLYGVIFLFRYPTDRPYASPDGPLDGSFDHDAAEHMFFAAQTIQNACATQALLSVLMNKTEDVDVGSQLRDFRDFTMVLPPEFRGEALSNSDLIREVHNSFARSSPFADETQKTGDPEDAFHFIAYTTVNDTLYELDGLQPAPISHGPCTLHEFPNMIVEVLQRRVARYETTEIRFNLLAMCRDLRIRARRFGEHELMAREEMKRRNWQFENALRRHNFVGFAGELLKGVVDYKLHEGGDAAVIKWVDESLQRRMAAERALRGGDEDVDMH
ncbi:hypothetical protein ED733_004705 [Metarhizium rileyi]|uniref:Ubiquitin carboxyl-terminal hydrolase n=1 Tax=Metarhizium rileyi (strain RCEF 4871) TaxID=1649241 RepID=A0A5C6GAW2_METRR|nr:hypothetical protein ED733_004705 [Metarhizium rileyi]